MIGARRWFQTALVALATLGFYGPTAQAYPDYSEGLISHPAGSSRCRAPDVDVDGCEEPFGYCKTCHGDFRATDETNSRPYLRDEYVSPSDGKRWREVYQEVEAEEPEDEIGLHEIHRHVILDKFGRSRCDTCHGADGRYPVSLDTSVTVDFEPISCMGCHGRNEDNAPPNLSAPYGRGAGLRQHHSNAGVAVCKTCHWDADPANYTPVGENVPPPWYFLPDALYPNKPTDPCNRKRAEDYAGKKRGLDNDGDGRYDKQDRDCKN